MRINTGKTKKKTNVKGKGILSLTNPKMLAIVAAVGVVLICGITLLALFLTGVIGGKDEIDNFETQYFTASGVIKYGDEPLEGVTVRSQNTQRLTNSQGEFSERSLRKDSMLFFQSDYYNFTPSFVEIKEDTTNIAVSATLKGSSPVETVLYFYDGVGEPLGVDFDFYIDEEANAYHYSASVGYCEVMSIAGQFIYLTENSREFLKIDTYRMIKNDDNAFTISMLQNSVQVYFKNGDGNTVDEDFTAQINGQDISVIDGRCTVLVKMGQIITLTHDVLALYDLDTSDVVDELTVGEITEDTLVVEVAYKDTATPMREFTIVDGIGNAVRFDGMSLGYGINSKNIINGYCEINLANNTELSFASDKTKLPNDSQIIVDNRHLEYRIVVEYTETEITLSFRDIMDSAIAGVQVYAASDPSNEIATSNSSGVAQVTLSGADMELVFKSQDGVTTLEDYSFENITINRDRTSYVVVGKCIRFTGVNITVLRQGGEPYDKLFAYIRKGNTVVEVEEGNTLDTEGGRRTSVYIASDLISGGYDSLSIYAYYSDMGTQVYHSYKIDGSTNIDCSLSEMENAVVAKRYSGTIKLYNSVTDATTDATSINFVTENGYCFKSNITAGFDICLPEDEIIFIGEYFPIDEATANYKVIDIRDVVETEDAEYILLYTDTQVTGGSFVYTVDATEVSNYTDTMTLRFVMTSGHEVVYVAERGEEMSFVLDNVILPYKDSQQIKDDIQIFVDDVPYVYSVSDNRIIIRN